MPPPALMPVASVGACPLARACSPTDQPLATISCQLRTRSRRSPSPPSSHADDPACRCACKPARPCCRPYALARSRPYHGGIRSLQRPSHESWSAARAEPARRQDRESRKPERPAFSSLPWIRRITAERIMYEIAEPYGDENTKLQSSIRGKASSRSVSLSGKGAETQ